MKLTSQGIASIIYEETAKEEFFIQKIGKKGK